MMQRRVHSRGQSGKFPHLSGRVIARTIPGLLAKSRGSPKNERVRWQCAVLLRYVRFPAPMPGRYAGCRARFPANLAIAVGTPRPVSARLLRPEKGIDPGGSHAHASFRLPHPVSRAHIREWFRAGDSAPGSGRLCPPPPVIYLPERRSGPTCAALQSPLLCRWLRRCQAYSRPRRPTGVATKSAHPMEAVHNSNRWPRAGFGGAVQFLCVEWR